MKTTQIARARAYVAYCTLGLFFRMYF